MLTVTPSAVRVVVADDHALFRQGLKSVLKLRSDVTVVGEIECASDIFPVLERTPCDVLLLDLQMDRNCADEIERIVGRVKVVIVTASERADDAMAAIRAGASAVVFKRFALETLMEAVHAAVGGGVWLPPAVQRELATRNVAVKSDRLTAREREIVRQVARGFRNAEVAERLSISEVTVKWHLNNVFQKLAIRDRVELALYAIQAGLVGVPDRAR